MSQNTDYSTRPFHSGIELREFINPITGKPYIVTRTASIADVPNYYREAYVQGQWDLFNLPSDMALQAYLDQKADGGFWGAGRRMFADTFSDMWSKWFSFSTYALDSSRAQFEDDLAGYMPEYGAKRRTVYTNPIYAESGKRLYQSDYLAMQFGNLGTSVAMMAGMLIEQGALALLTAPFGGAGAAVNTGSVGIRAARLLSSANKVRAISSTALAAYSGFREAYINGLEAGQEVYNEVLRQTGNRELAIQQAQYAVAQQVSKEGLTTATLNTLQWGLLGLTPKINANLSLAKGAKGMIGKIGRQVGRKSVELPKWGVSSIVEDGVDFFVGKIGNKYARGAIRFTGNVLSEGFEEGYQGYISNKVARSVLKNADLEYEHIDLIDAQLWDEVVGGMIGGALFAGVGAVSRGLHKTILKDDYNKLEEIKKHRKEIFKQAENEIRKWTSENLILSAALTQERIDLVTEQAELIDKQDKDSILRKQQIDRELEDNKRRSDKAKDISTMNVALISLIGDVVQDSPSMALTTSSLAKLEETKSALQAYIQEYNKWEASTGIFPFAESELSKEGNETKREIVRILKEQGLLDDSNNLEDSRYLTDGVQIYDNQIKVFENTLKDFSEYYDKYSTDLTLTGEYVQNSYLLREAQKHLAKLNTMVDPVTKKTVGAYEMIYDQITDENREHENTIKLFDILLKDVATKLFDKYDSKYTYAHAYIDLATYDAALNDESFKKLIGEDEFKRLEYKFNKDKKFAKFADDARGSNYYNENAAYIKKVISDKINAEKSIKENKEKIKKLQDEKFLYDEFQKQIEEQTKEVEELQKDVNQAKDPKYIEKVLIERQFNEKTVLENANKYNTKQLRRYIDELTNIAKTQEHKDLIKKIETILEEKEKQKTQKSKPKKGEPKKSKPKKGEDEKGEDEKGEDENLENMASRTVNARKAAETVTTGSIESEMDAKEIIQNVNSVERAFEEGHLTNETSKEEIEKTIRHLLNLFKEKSGKGDSTLPLHSLGLTINKLYNLLYVSGKADIVKIVLSNDTLMQVLDNLVFQHFKDISQERKNKAIHKIVTNNGKGFTFKVESEDSNGKKTTKEVNSNIFTKAVFYGAGDAFHAEFNAIIDEVVKELNKEFKKETKSESETIVTITNNQSDIEAKKADVEIGKVGNTEYEVKADGVYYQGKKLDNPENKTHRQLIEDDIKRRREEDLDAITEMAALQLLLTLAEASFTSVPIIKGKLMEGEFNGGLKVYTPLKSLQGKKAETNSKDVWISFTSDVDDISAPSQKAEIDKVNDEFYSMYEEINTKYEAELAALEAQITTQQEQQNKKEIETEKQSEIERRRQEELDKYWDRLLRQIKDEKEREREVKRVTTDIINARKVADKFLSLVSTKSVDEFLKWIDENPYDAVMLQNELEEHRLTKDLWKYGFDRTSIPYRRNTIDEYLYDFLTTDVDKINAKYDAEIDALKEQSNTKSESETIVTIANNLKIPFTDLAKINRDEVGDPYNENREGEVKWIIEGLEDFEWAVFNSEKEAQNARKELLRYIRSLDKEITPAIDIENTIKNNVRNFLEGASSPTSYTSAMFTSKFFGQKLIIEDGVPKMEVDTMKYMENLYLVTVGRIIEKSTKKGKTEYVVGFSDFIDTVISLNFPFSLIEESMEWYAAGWNQLNDSKLDLKELTEYGLRHLHKRRQTQIEKSKETEETDKSKTKTVISVETKDISGDTAVSINEAGSMNIIPMTTRVSFSFNSRSGKEQLSTKEGEVIDVKKGKNSTLLQESLAIEGMYYVLDAKFWVDELEKAQKENKQVVLNAELADRKLWDGWKPFYYTRKEVDGKIKTTSQTANSWEEFYYIEFGKIEGAKYTVERVNELLDLFFSKDFDPSQLSEVDKKAYAIFLSTTPILLTYDYNGERKAVAYMIGSHLLDGKYQGDVLKAMKEKILNQRYQAIHNGGKVVITKYLQHKFATVVDEGISGNEAIAVISERNKEAGLKETVDIVRGIDRHKNDEIVLQRVDQNASHQLRIEDGYSFVDGKKVKNIRYLPLSWKKNPITGQRDGSVTSMPWVYNYIKYATLFYSIAELKSIRKNTKFTEDNYTNLYTKLTELLSIVPNLSNFGIDNKVAGFVVNEENIDTIIEGAKKALEKLGINNYDSKIKYFIYKGELVNFKNSVIPTMGVQNPHEVIRKIASLWHNLSEDGVFSEMDGNKCKIKLAIETELIKNTTKIQKPNLTFNSLLVDDNNTLVEETIVDTKGNKEKVRKHYIYDYILEHEITDKINSIEGVSGNTAKIFSIQPTVEYEVYDADGKIVDHKYNKTEVTKAEEIADEIKNYKQDESLEELQNEVVRSFDFEDIDINTEEIVVRGMNPMQFLNVLERTQNKNFKNIKDLYDYGVFDHPIRPIFRFLKSDKPSITKQKRIDIVGKLDVPVFDEKITNFNDTIYTLNGVSTKDQIDLVNSLIPIIFEKYVNETKNFKAFNITLLNELIRNTTRSVLENKLRFLQQSNPHILSREAFQFSILNDLLNNNSIEDVENVIKRVLKYQYSVSQIELEAKDVENIKSNSFSWDELTYEKTGFNKLSGLVKMALSVIRVGEDHPKKSQLNAFGLPNYEDPLYVYLNLQTVMYSTSNNIADIINTLENTELESSRKSNVYKQLTTIFKNSLDDKNAFILNFPGPILNQLITKLHLHKNEMKVVDVTRGNKKNKNKTKSVLRSANLQSSRTRRIIETNSRFFTNHTTPKIVNNVRVNLWNVERLKTTKKNIQVIMDRYEKDNSLESVSYEDLNQLLVSMGIFLSKSTIKGKRRDFILKKLFSKFKKDYSLGFLYIEFIDSILNDNSNVVTQGDKIVEGYKKIDSNKSLVLENASGTYNSIISIEIENEDFELAPAYIDGKNIHPLVQNMQIFDVFRDLKTSMKEGKGVNTWSDYINAVNTSNNYFIKMLNNMDEEQRMEVLKQIDVTFLGPSIIRDAIDKVNSGDIGSVTEQEYILTLCAYMQQPTAVRPTILNNEEYYFREGYGWIPTPSDKGKIVGISLPLLDLRSYRKGEENTVLKDVYININTDGKVVLSLDNRILDLLVDQFFVSELKRMIAIGQNSSYVNSKAMKEHNYFFTTFKQFNNYFVEDGDVQVPLTEWLKQKIDDPNQQLNEETLIEMIMDNFKNTVRKDIEKHLQDELDKFIEVRVDVEQNDDPKKTKNVKEYHVKGKLFDSNIVTVDESNNKVFNNNLMDNKFLWDRMGVTKDNYSRDLKVHNMDGSSTNVSLNLQTTMIAMFDTIINNRLALKVITDLTTNPTELIKSSPKWNYKVDREVAIQEWTNSVNETSSALDSLITRRFAKLIAPGYKEANSDIYYQNGQQQHAVVEVNGRSISNTSFQLIQAINMPSTVANVAIKMNILYPEVKSEVYQKEIELYAAKQGQLERLRKEGNDDADVLNELLNIIKELQTKYPKIAQFLSVDSTDGQAYCTYTEYLKHLYGIGEISLDDFKFYDNIFGKLNRKEISFADLTEEERYKLHTLYANSVKTVYTGGLYEYTPQTEEQINNNEPQTPLYKRDIYLKMSVFPLLPGFTEGKQIDNLRIHMENVEKNNSKNGVVEPVILVFQNSSMKFGSNENPVPLSTLYKDNLSDDEQAQLNKVITSLPRSNYKQQQSTTSDAEVSLSRNKQQTFPKATQPTALALENGISKIEDFIFPVIGQLENLIREYNKINPSDKIKVNKNRINGKSIVKLNNFLHNRIITHQYNELISELIKEKEGTVSVEGMYKIIEKEVISRGMNVDILNQLKLREFESEDGVISIDFSFDLWVSDIAESVSDLLFSIPRNKVRKIEMPGNSHYLVSSSGMLTGTSDNAIKNADKNSIVYFDKTYDGSKELGMRYIGEQNGVPVYEYEMLIPHHFMLRGDDGQSYFIDLYEKDEDGNYVWIEEKLDANDKRIGFYLKENKFSQELLKSLSFRIPTSNANMIVKGKAVGFLPDMYRDVVIFGKDHIAQLGEDFDIDVRYIYKYFYALRGGKFQRVKFNINNQQSLKNSLLDVYFSIYETGNPELQQEFHKALSTEVEEFTAREFKKMFHEEDDNTTFYDLSYNMENMQGADIASDAIGIHALDRKMLSVMDKSGLSDLEFTTTTTVFEEESDGTVHVVSKDIPFRFVLGEVDNTKIKGDNKVKLGRHKTIDGQRSIFDSSNNRLQAAVDNQAKGILSAVNENTTTVNVIRFLDAIGFNSHWNDGKNTWDLAYMFISQPILRDYSRLMKNIKSIFSDEFKYNKLMDLIEQYGVKTNRENKVDYVRRDQLLWALAEHLGFTKVIKDKDGEEITVLDVDEKSDLCYYDPNNIFKLDKFYKLSAKLTPNKLLNELKNNKTPDQELQLIVLMKFLELEEQALKYNDLASLLNKSDKIKDMFDVIDVKKTLAGLIEGNGINNSFGLIGEYIDDVENKLASGEITHKDLYGFYEMELDGIKYYIKPTTTEGMELIHVLRAIDKFITPYYPYNNPNIESVIKIIQNNAKSVYTKNDKKAKELHEDIIKSLRKYLEKSPENGLIDSDISYRSALSILFKDSEENESLGTYIQALRSRGVRSISGFIDKLTVRIDDTTTLVDGNFLNLDVNELSDIQFIFKNMLNNTDPIVDNYGISILWNGKEVTYRELAQTFIVYNKLRSTNSSLLGFNNVFPSEYYDFVGFSNQLNENVDDFLYGDNSSEHVKIFTRQYAQSNIELFPETILEKDKTYFTDFTHIFKGEYSLEEFREVITNLERVLTGDPNLKVRDVDIMQYMSSFTTTEFSKEFLKFRTSKNDYILFEKVLTEGETSVYKQISVLDAKNVNQYQYGVPYVIDLDDNYNEIKRKTLKKKIDLKELEPVVIKNPNNKSFIGYLDSIEEHDVYRSGNNILKGATTLDKFLQEETVQGLFTNNEEKQAILNDFAHLGGEDVVVIPIYSSKTKQYDGGFQSILQAAINKNTKKGKIIAFSASYDIFGDGNEKQVIVFLIDDLKNREEKLHSDTILEELIHTRELKIFNKYFKTEKGKLTLREDVDKNSIPVEVNILNSLYEQAYKKFGKEIELKLKELENNGKSTSKEYNDYLKFQYAMSNVHEFIAHTMYSGEFREALDSSMKDATFVERIINAVVNMFKRFFKESEHKYSNYVIDATYRLISKGYSTNVNVYETYRNRIKDKLNETISDYEQLYDELNNELFIDNTRSLVPNINKDQVEEVKYTESNASDSIDEKVNNQGDVTFEVTMDSVFSLFNEIDGLENNVYEVFNAITEEEQLEAREFYRRYMEFIMNNHDIQNWDEIQKLLSDMNKFKEFVDQKEVESENIEEKYKQADSDLQGVSELFESDPKLANAVYEALGYSQESNLPTSDETINIYAGSNQNAELSNFAIRPFTINVETPSGEKQYTFQSVEQGFHFYKALVANNPQVAEQVLATTNGGQLKRLTNRSNLKMTPEQVKEWDDTAKSIMLNLMYDSYAQNPKAAEKLLATGNAKITHTQDNTRWKTDFPEVVMTVRDMLKEEGFGTQSQITPQQKQQAQQVYSQYLEQNPNGNVEQFKSWVDSNQSNVQYQKQIDLQAEQDSVLEEFANSLSERFNISFDLVSEEEAKSISSEYDNEPAFFDPKTKKAYLVKGKANKTSAIHEIFTHPFLLQIEKTNPTLYKNLLKEAKNNKSIVDYVDNLYGTNQNNDHEYIARAIDLAVQGELNQQKDKTLLERIQDFFNQLFDYLKKLFNIPKVFSSAISPNITLQQLTQFAMYGKGRMDLNPAQENIEYSLKATSVIVKNLSKIKQWEKNKSISEDVLWNKIQGLGVPKEQLELVKNSEGNTVEEKLLDFTNQYSYTVEINTAKEELPHYDMVDVTGEGDFEPQEFIPDTELITIEDDEGNVIGVEEVLSERGKKQIEERENRRKPTQHYSNLTVPGGTNYTENKIETPAITPSIQGHPAWVKSDGTDNGIGWFRSDEQVTGGQIEDDFADLDEGERYYAEWVAQDQLLNTKRTVGGETTKTRRILEIQSDLFQKGRNNKVLSKKLEIRKVGDTFTSNGEQFTVTFIDTDSNLEELITIQNSQGRTATMRRSQLEKRFDERGDNSSENQFLQLLNKNNNWVTFFIKSIIQDSAKKGYEKVLFPTSEVVSQIQKFDEAAEKYSNAISKLEKDRTSEDNFIISEWEKDSTKRTIKGTLDFYNNLRNILDDLVGGNKNDRKKGIYKLQQITDEYGNTWNEITIDENRDNQNIVFQKFVQDKPGSVKPGVEELFESNPELANAVYEALGLNTINVSEITYTDEEGNPCAKMGLTNTVKGTNWKIVKDFKGKPKHSNGGVDITISDKGVTIRRGGKDIKAKYGLLIINNN